MTIDEYLLPCAFCRATTANVFQLPQGRYMVGCGSCPAQMTADNRPQAIAAWNTRAEPAGAGERDLAWWEAWLEVRFGRAEYLQLNRTWKLRRLREVAADLMELIAQMKS